MRIQAISAGRLACVVAAMVLLPALRPAPAASQVEAAVDSTLPEAGARPGLPVLFTLGLAWGQRGDACAFCTTADDTDSFSAHLSLARPMGGGLGLGIDVSVWQRSSPGPLDPDAEGDGPVALPLVNRLGNLSVVGSWQSGPLFLRAGLGAALGRQDLVDPQDDDGATILSASGTGVGYTLGGGIAIPLHDLISIAVFANWNAGYYDLTSPRGVLGRDVQHQVLEIGFGLSTR